MIKFIRKKILNFLVIFFSISTLSAVQIQTKSLIGNVVWSLEKTSGTMRVKNEIKVENGTNTHFYKSINYTGALINVELSDFLFIESLSNFGMLYHPQGIAWSDIQKKSQDIYSVYIQELAGFPVFINKRTTFFPFAGYSYLKLDFTKNYTFLPSGFAGHNIYHNVVFGIKEEYRLKKWLNLSFREMISPLAFYYPFHGSRALCIEIGSEARFDFEYFGIHLYISSRRTVEHGSYYEKYESSISDFGFTFRIGERSTEFFSID